MYQQFLPSIFFSPGEILQDELEASGLTSEDLSNISEDLPELVNGIIQRNQPITYRIAIMLHKAFGTSPEFWMNLEADYRLYLAHKE